MDFEVAEEGLAGVAVFEAPGGNAADGRDAGWGRGVVIGEEDFGGGETGEFFVEVADVGELGGGEFAGGDVGVSEAGFVVEIVDGGEVVVLVGGKHAGFEDGPGGEDADDFTGHETFNGFGADLFAEGDFVPFGDEFSDVALGRMVGHTGHRHPLTFADVTAGEDEVEFLGGGFGVGVEHFVEVAEAEEEDSVLVLGFDIEVLAADGGYFFLFRHIC